MRTPTPPLIRWTLGSWAIHSVGGKGPDAGLFFDGPVAKSVYGNRVLYIRQRPFFRNPASLTSTAKAIPMRVLFSPITHLTSHVLVDRPVPQELTLLKRHLPISVTKLGKISLLLSLRKPN